jgi:hypothetical protein
MRRRDEASFIPPRLRWGYDRLVSYGRPNDHFNPAIAMKW